MHAYTDKDRTPRKEKGVYGWKEKENSEQKEKQGRSGPDRPRTGQDPSESGLRTTTELREKRGGENDDDDDGDGDDDIM